MQYYLSYKFHVAILLQSMKFLPLNSPIMTLVRKSHINQHPRLGFAPWDKKANYHGSYRKKIAGWNTISEAFSAVCNKTLSFSLTLLSWYVWYFRYLTFSWLRQVVDKAQSLDTNILAIRDTSSVIFSKYWPMANIQDSAKCLIKVKWTYPVSKLYERYVTIRWSYWDICQALFIAEG